MPSKAIERVIATFEVDGILVNIGVAPDMIGGPMSSKVLPKILVYPKVRDH
jgi:hypothetical protein